MAGLIPFPFEEKGSTGANANDLESGFYSVYLGSAASTLNYPYEYGIIICFALANSLKLQIMTNADHLAPKASLRFRWDTWSTWSALF